MIAKIIIGVWAVIVCGMCLVPPWVKVCNIPKGMYGLKEAHQRSEDFCYEWIFTPPRLIKLTTFDHTWSVQVDWQSLFLQIFAVSVLAGGVIFIAGNWREWKIHMENRILKKVLEKLELQRKINAILDGPDEI